LKSRALRWLAQRDHSRVELERKLLTHARALARLADATAVPEERAHPDSLLRERIAGVIDGLAAAGLLNEPRMAESLLAARAPRLGERRLRQVMQQRGLEPGLVDAALQQARGSELERAQALWQRRFGAPGATPAERARQMRFLAGRGFGGDVIRRVVRGSADDDDPVPGDPVD
jgi:regulatory protein